jgi:hypothetical protein
MSKVKGQRQKIQYEEHEWYEKRRKKRKESGKHRPGSFEKLKILSIQ